MSRKRRYEMKGKNKQACMRRSKGDDEEEEEQQEKSKT